MKHSTEPNMQILIYIYIYIYFVFSPSLFSRKTNYDHFIQFDHTRTSPLLAPPAVISDGRYRFYTSPLTSYISAWLGF